MTKSRLHSILDKEINWTEEQKASLKRGQDIKKIVFSLHETDVNLQLRKTSNYI